MKICYEDNHIIVVIKKPNIPTQEDDSKDPDMLSLIKNMIKVRDEKPGNVYLGLVHRLDRPVGGLMVFAKTSKAASRLSNQVRQSEFTKRYTAIVYGKPTLGLYEDMVAKDKKRNTSFVVSSTHPQAKKAQLCVEKVDYNKTKNLSKVKILLITGRSHQIRVQFAARNHPLWGDARYNKDASSGQQIALWATELSFFHPTTKKRLTFSCETPNTYPFTLWNNASSEALRASQSE